MIIELRKCIAGGFTVHEEVKPWTTPRTFHESAFTTLPEALAFIRSRMEPEGEGEKGKENWPSGQEYRDEIWRKFNADMKADHAAAPEEPAWKRAKVGDWIKLRNGLVTKVTRISEPKHHHDCRLMMASNWIPGSHLFVGNTEVAAILPEPPRHGDFGSLNHEDGA